MHEVTRRSLIAAGLSAPLLRPAAAQEVFPSRPVTLVIPWAAGGSTDVMGRVIAQAMSADLGQPVVVENRGGASGTIGHNHVARARPDGYTFLLGTNSTFAIAPHLLANIPYDNRAAFTGISLVARSAQGLCIHPSIPANTVQEFIAYAKAKPGEVTFSSAGIGASSHLATELFQAKAGIRLLHVPYRGGGPSVQGLLAGEVAMSFVDLVTCLPFRASGQLKVLGVGTAQRSAFAPDLPALAEAGVPGFASSTDVIMLLPAGTPAPIVTRMTASLQKALRDPATKERLNTMAVEIIGSSAAELDTYWTAEIAKWGEIIRSQNIKT
ncbi:Bug family tripartite tricarboxylate transporter substrate binding protein [Falsiroseomonas selenitidurans]|uniref:Tripartite tricarboxylate transporter substrate binding protein n=1 Tax=Falsiroseomonas selenitidurans TaxID=2716335 RepID=A0ABX1E2Q5_9PROT|nr:tripartite tricarboxylate transporter substrate binding protein [Falsiroseomonas selenitidurans]NKC31442.1 tripartite tricarboxylate transporter substrate binding protein [Falsiroseomonas selenitidurans]